MYITTLYLISSDTQTIRGGHAESMHNTLTFRWEVVKIRFSFADIR